MLYSWPGCARLSPPRVARGTLGSTEKGVHVQRYLGRTVLICEECGQRLVISDPEFIRDLEHLVLECGCGEGLTVVDRIVEGDPKPGAA